MPGTFLLSDGKEGGYGPKLQVEMPRPKSIEVGNGGHVSSLFSSPLNFLTISYFGFKIKKKRFSPGASPAAPVTRAQPSPPHGPPGLHPVPGLLLGLKAPGAVGLCRVTGPRRGGEGTWPEQLPRNPQPQASLSNPVNSPALILEHPPLVLSSFPLPRAPALNFTFFFFLGALFFSYRSSQNGCSLHELKLFVFPQ